MQEVGTYNASKVGLCKTAMMTDALVPGSGQLIAGGRTGTWTWTGTPPCSAS